MSGYTCAGMNYNDVPKNLKTGIEVIFHNTSMKQRMTSFIQFQMKCPWNIGDQTELDTS